MHTPIHSRRRRWMRVLMWAAVALLLATVFMAYHNPHRVVELANRVWACF
jgi:hypothetical protein